MGGVGAADGLRGIPLFRQLCAGFHIRTDTVVIAHDDERGAEAVTEQSQILGGRHGGERTVERKDLHTVYTAGVKQLLLFLHRAQ